MSPTSSHHRRSTAPGSRGPRYLPPSDIAASTVAALNNGARSLGPQALLRLTEDLDEGATVYAAGDLTLLHGPAVAIVGSRESSLEGQRRAYQLGRDLGRAGFVVVSGLARGIDTAAHNGALDARGRTVAVIGTPLDSAYPAENRALQERIYREHLLVSPFKVGTRVHPSNFPVRNKVMAALTDATIIVEASNTSGALHQAAECARLPRPLWIPESVVSNPALTWPARFISSGTALILSSVEDVLARLKGRGAVPRLP